MEKTHFSNWMADVYAIFGRNRPQAEIMRVIYERVETLPDDFFSYAKGVIADMDDLPRNMGKLLKTVLWPEYLGKHPELRSHADYCPECGAGGGWIVRRIINERGVGMDKSFPCVCQVGKDAGWTLERIKEAGYVIEEPDPVNIEQAKQALARLGIRLGEITDDRADERTARLPDYERANARNTANAAAW